MMGAISGSWDDAGDWDDAGGDARDWDGAEGDIGGVDESVVGRRHL